MATGTRDQTKKIPLFPLLSLLCFVSIFFVLSISRKTSPSSRSPQPVHFNPPATNPSSSCDYTRGSWIHGPSSRSIPYDSTCKEIFKGWNCISSKKSNAKDILHWRWQPQHCDLPQFNPTSFLETYRDTNIDANGGELESLGYKEGYRIDVDIPDSSWVDAPKFHDVLIFNTGHWWWAPAKFDPVKSPMLFFEKGRPVIPPITPDVGLDKVLKHMIHFVDSSMHPGGIKIFRTQSPRHFEGGDWDQGGSCPRVAPLLPEQVEELFSPMNNGTNVETRLVNEHLFRGLKGSSFHVLDITQMSEFRADAHPAAAGGKQHDDCMHWCLPGITDTWNDLLVTKLHIIKNRS